MRIMRIAGALVVALMAGCLADDEPAPPANAAAEDDDADDDAGASFDAFEYPADVASAADAGDFVRTNPFAYRNPWS